MKANMYNQPVAILVVILCLGCVSRSREGVEPKILLAVYDSRATLDRETREIDIELEVGMKSASSTAVTAQPFFPRAFAEAEGNPWIKSWPLVVSQEPSAGKYLKSVILDGKEERFHVKLSGPFTLPIDAPPITNDVVWFSVRYDHKGIISNPVRFNLTIR